MKRSFSHEQPVSRIDPVTDEELMQDESEVGEEIRATVAALMPWGVSILAHVGLIVLAFFLVWQTIVQEEPRPLPPEVSIAPPVAPPMTPNPDPLEDLQPSGAVIQPVIAPVTPVQIIAPGQDLPQVVLPVRDLTDSPICCGPPTKSRKPDGPIFTDPGADDVVFLIDASGSMVDVLPFVISELKQVVNNMQSYAVNGQAIDRKATVIFFSGDGVHEVPGGGGVKGLRTMTPKFKEQIRQWVSLENFNYSTGGRGSAHVKDALQRALSYKPELVILLSDNLTGGGQGATQHELMQDELIELIHQHNKAQPPAKINTIQFLYEDPLVRAGLPATLNRIADETGGKFKFISQGDLNLR